VLVYAICPDFTMSAWPIIETEDGDSDGGFLEKQCRRFRILVMGKSGVGKSTLLSMVFGIPEKEVSDERDRASHVPAILTKLRRVYAIRMKEKASIRSGTGRSRETIHC
jgi:putative ribosome biogenesis GTPase RsgA